MTPRLVLVLAFVLSLPLVSTRIRGADEIQYFSYLRSMVFDRDLEFGNEYAYFYAQDPEGLGGFRQTFLELREPATGRHINFGPLGSALLWSPFYLVAHDAVLLARALGAAVPADGYSWPYVAAVSYASAFLGFLGILLCYETLVRWGRISPRAALLAVLALWFATPVFYYVTVAPAFSHASSLFAVALVVALSLRAYDKSRPRLFDWVACGAAAGLAALVREQDGLFLVLPLGLLAVHSWRERDRRRALLGAVFMAYAAFAAFLPQLFAYKAINGSWGPTKLVARKMSYTSPHFFDVLIDPAHGLFAWSPFALLATGGLVALAWQRRSALVVALFGALVLQVWINGAVLSWTQAGAFGARRFVSVMPILGFGFAFILAELRSLGRQSLALALVAGLTWWNVSLMVQFGLRLMDRQGLRWPDVAIQQFTEVPPRLFRTLLLYATDQERLVEESR